MKRILVGILVLVLVSTSCAWAHNWVILDYGSLKCQDTKGLPEVFRSPFSAFQAAKTTGYDASINVLRWYPAQVPFVVSVEYEPNIGQPKVSFLYFNNDGGRGMIACKIIIMKTVGSPSQLK